MYPLLPINLTLLYAICYNTYMQSTRGFTVIELLVLIILIVVTAIVAVVQVQDIRASERDNERKTDINAMHYGLEKVFYEKNKYFPETISPEVLPYVAPASFKDPAGLEINDRKSNYRYNASGCSEGKCRGYSLRSVLQKEADYVKNELTIRQ